MIRRGFAGAVASLSALALALGVGLVGCASEPAPAETTPPPFASEEEAFAAAEATYRAYVDALNQVDLSDPETFEAVYAWTTGEANANERRNLSQMHANNWTVSGDTELIIVRPRAVERNEVVSDICVDVSEVQVKDSSGVSQVASARPPRYSLDVRFSTSATATGVAISESEANNGDTCGE